MAGGPGTGPFGATLAEIAKLNVREVKDAARWARHVNPATCGGVHDWECGKKACPDCWQPKCDSNAKKEQENYEEDQSGSVEDKIKAQKAVNKKKIRNGHDPHGIAFEEQAVEKVKSNEKIEHIGYVAHCKVCHMQGDLDIVTENSVIECKRSARGANLRQMQENIIPIANKCFPGKQVKVATRSTELPRLQNTVASAAWAPHNVGAMDP